MIKNNGLRVKSSIEAEWSRDLFNKFLEEIPPYYKMVNKTIPFFFVYFWFSHRKIDKKTAFKIIQIWESLDFCKIVTYTGICIKNE